MLENFYRDKYLESVEFLEKPIIRYEELVHPRHLGGFKFFLFESNLRDLADQIDESAQSTEPKIIVSTKEESIQMLGLKRDRNNDTLVVSSSTNSSCLESLT